MKYINSFYNSRYQDSKFEIETDIVPIKYKGYLIYHRLRTTFEYGDIFEVVKDGVCVGIARPKAE